MKKVAVAAQRRIETGKGPNRRLRASGQIPAVLYGVGTAPEKLSLDAHDFGKILVSAQSGNVLLAVNVSGQSVSGDDNVAIVREVQRDPLTRRVMHVDLYRIRMDVENTFEVPVHASGTPVGVREGGILETHRYTVELRCLPTALPQVLNVDLTNLKINSAFHAGDVALPEGVKLVTAPEEVIYTVLPPKVEAEPTPAVPGEEVAQPEVIGKKKAEKEAEQK